MKFQKKHDDSEFIWLVSLSDLMILLFVFFVVLFSFSFQEVSQVEFKKAMAAMNGSEFKTPIDEVHQELKAALVANSLSEQVEITQKNDQLILDVKDIFLFDIGKSRLKDSSKEILKTIARSLDKVPVPYRVAIEGHTDDTPIPNGSNFDLSINRALTVYHQLLVSEQLKKRIVIMGYGKTSPRVENRDEKGRPIPANQSQNRRVTFRIY